MDVVLRGLPERGLVTRLATAPHGRELHTDDLLETLATCIRNLGS